MTINLPALPEKTPESTEWLTWSTVLDTHGNILITLEQHTQDGTTQELVHVIQPEVPGAEAEAARVWANYTAVQGRTPRTPEPITRDTTPAATVRTH